MMKTSMVWVIALAACATCAAVLALDEDFSPWSSPAPKDYYQAEYSRLQIVSAHGWDILKR